IDWDTEPGVREVQSVRSFADTGPNEIQTVTITAADIDEVQRVVTSANAMLEIQQITVSDASSGSFMLSLDLTAGGGGIQTSGEIQYNAVSTGGYESLHDILEAMPNLGGGAVANVSAAYSVDSDGLYTHVWNVTFAESFGDVPQLTLAAADLAPMGADVQIATLTDGNVIGGMFRLGFGGYTTEAVAADSTDAEVAAALEALPSVDSVVVERTGPDDQGGYNWTVTFTAPGQDGDLSTMVPYSDLLTGAGAAVDVFSVTDGSELSGWLNLSFPSWNFTAGKAALASSDPYDISASVPYDATEAEFKAALQGLGSGEVEVVRSGPDGQRGYRWRISFLSLAGNVPAIVADASSLWGGNGMAAAEVAETRAGTRQEVQVVSANGTDLANGTYFVLSFGGAATGPIPAGVNHSCAASAPEVQTIVTSTVDTTSSGGDAHVSFALTLRIVWYNAAGEAYETDDLDANPDFGNCTAPAVAIQAALEAVMEEAGAGGAGGVNVTAVGGGGDDSCSWSVTFLGAPGNLPQMEVYAGTNGPLSSAAWGDDTVTVETVRNGSVDIIKQELELLEGVGLVVVTADGDPADDWCEWAITFVTNAGAGAGANASLELLQIASYNAVTGATGNFSESAELVLAQSSSAPSYAGHNVTVMRQLAGTSIMLGGDFALELDGFRTQYLPYDASARDVKLALEALETLGSVDVTLADGDAAVDGGRTWLVTFRTDFWGDVPELTADVLSMTGTAPTIIVAEEIRGVAPPFDTSLSADDSLPLGSVSLVDLTALTVDVTGLAQGVEYFFRVAAANALGFGPAALARQGWAAPEPVPADPPVNATMEPVDGDTLRVTFWPPAGTGGLQVDRYRVEHGPEPLRDEVQAVRLSCLALPEVQMVATAADAVPEVQLVHLKMEEGFLYGGAEVAEVQSVTCDASGGSFTLSFDGQTTDAVAYDATAAEVAAALEELAGVNAVTVNFSVNAMAACDVYPNEPTFNVTFVDVVNFRGDVPLMTASNANLEGNRRLTLIEATQGEAAMSGTLRLTFRGFTTAQIPYNADVATVAAALARLDPIGLGGVNVTLASLGSYAEERMWRVTFVGASVEGNIEAMQVLPYNDMLMGNGAEAAVYAGGAETASERRAATASSDGNALDGTFTLTLRGWTTAPIDHDASDTAVKAALEALPNVGTVAVTRTGPDGQRGYAWSITFLSNPGYFPSGAGDVSALIPDITKMTGDGAACNVTEEMAGSDPLGGVFQLAFYDDSGNATYHTNELYYNAEADEVKATLEAVPAVGTVDVVRADVSGGSGQGGYEWLITF
ncbi:unnamed protein product, partial [Phaeothamnion confervicola]